MTGGPRVVVNARYLRQPTTGVQRFAQEISEELAGLRSDVAFVSPRGALQAAAYPVTQFGRAQGHLWEQAELPAFLRSVGRPLLVTLTSTAPVAYRHQIMTHHDITYVRHPGSFSWSFRALYGALTPPALKSAHRVITVSEFSRTEISAHYSVAEDRIDVVANAVGAGFSPGARNTQEPYFLAVSSPNKHKNFDSLLRAFGASGLSDRFTLKIVGAQSAAFARATIDRTPGVEHLGRISDEELAEAYRGATAFLFPSLYEGFGIPPLEAQASGTPVLASRIPATEEVLGDTAHYFDPLNVEEMVSAMRRIAYDEELRTRLVQRGHENVSRFSWRSSAIKVDAIIESVLRTSRE